MSGFSQPKLAGQLAQSDIVGHTSGQISTAAVVLGACRAYYHAKASGQDAEGYRASIEKYLGFPLPVRQEWSMAEWSSWVAERKEMANAAEHHEPIFN